MSVPLSGEFGSFDVDSVVPYKEYVKTIYYHATEYTPTTRDANRIMKIAELLLQEVDRQQQRGKADLAFYYCIKCVQLFDREKTSVDVRNETPKAKKAMGAALSRAQELENGPLLYYYNEMIERIKQREPERRRIIAQQLEEDEPGTVPPYPGKTPLGNPTVATGEMGLAEHNLRRQQLMASEGAGVDQLRNLLKGTAIAGPATVPGAYSASGPGAQPPRPTSQYGLASTPQPPLPSPAPSYPVPSPYAVPQAPQPQPSRPTPPTTSSPVPMQVRPVYGLWKYNPQAIRPTFPRRGMVNLGNTCYLNSVTQMLNSSMLAGYFTRNDYVDSLVKKDDVYTRLVNSFSYIVRELRRADCSFAASPSPLKRTIGEIYEPFTDFKQQDANEFLRVLLDGLHTGLNRNRGNTEHMKEIDNTKGSDDDLSRMYWWQYSQKNSSMIADFCAFQERSSVECPACGQCSRSFPATMGIEVPIPRADRISVEDCVKSYCTKETLDSGSLFLCSGCKRKVNASKQILFFSTPRILFITLKRFRTYGDFSNVAKVTDPVFFQRELDLQPFMCSKFSLTRFRLVGVVNHMGNMHGGHYTADALGPDGVWFHCSDERLEIADQPDVRQAYILCYQRVE